MSAAPPKGQQHALSFARTLIEGLRFPAKAGKIQVCIDEIEDAWEALDLDQFPINLVYGELVGLGARLRREHDDPDQEIDSTSAVHDEVVALQHRLRMAVEFVVASKVFESVESRYQRIDGMLPGRNYAVRDLVSELRGDHIDLAIKRRLETALLHFDRQEYTAVLRECGEAGEALFALFKRHIQTSGCGAMPANMGRAMGHVRAWLGGESNQDDDGCGFSPRGRLEWLLLSMFESVHYFRNAAAHASEVEERLPDWQRGRRNMFGEKPEYARLVLCVTFQIALEIQALLVEQ